MHLQGEVTWNITYLAAFLLRSYANSAVQSFEVHNNESEMRIHCLKIYLPLHQNIADVDYGLVPNSVFYIA